VDKSCIDCDACRWMDDVTYGRSGLGTSVQVQPEDEAAKLKAFQAMISCPVGAIRTEKPDPFVKEAMKSFPMAIDKRLPNIYHLGFHQWQTFGAIPYLIVRPNGKNIMVDVPRYHHALADSIEALGGVSYLVLTHKDDVHGHKKWKNRFPDLVRVINRLDLDMEGQTKVCERWLEEEGDSMDQGPWYLDDLKDHEIVYTPGHTAGSISMHYQGQEGESVLFTGDTLCYSQRQMQLSGMTKYCKHDLERQAQTLEALAEGKFFQWILPGHGRRYRFLDEDGMRDLVSICAKEVRRGKIDLVEAIHF